MLSYYQDIAQDIWDFIPNTIDRFKYRVYLAVGKHAFDQENYLDAKYFLNKCIDLTESNEHVILLTYIGFLQAKTQRQLNAAINELSETILWVEQDKYEYKDITLINLLFKRAELFIFNEQFHLAQKDINTLETNTKQKFSAYQNKKINVYKKKCLAGLQKTSNSTKKILALPGMKVNRPIEKPMLNIDPIIDKHDLVVPANVEHGLPESSAYHCQKVKC